MSATFLFDTVMIVVFPLLGRWLGLSDAAFGLWAGTAAVSYTHLDVYKRQRWYYLSSLANQGLGNSIDALQDARRAAQMEPGNTEYQMNLRNLQDPGRTYRTQTTYAQPGGLMRWCWSMILLNLLCNCCCGGGWGWRFRM